MLNKLLKIIIKSLIFIIYLPCTIWIKIFTLGLKDELDIKWVEISSRMMYSIFIIISIPSLFIVDDYINLIPCTIPLISLIGMSIPPHVPKLIDFIINTINNFKEWLDD